MKLSSNPPGPLELSDSLISLDMSLTQAPSTNDIPSHSSSPPTPHALGHARPSDNKRLRLALT